MKNNKRTNKSISGNKRNKKNIKNNKTIKKNVFKKNVRCAPKSSNNGFSCISNEKLFQLKDDWNRNKDDKINTTNPREIWLFLYKKYQDDCLRESCLIKKSSIDTNKKIEMMRESFAPKVPNEWNDDPTSWLSSNDIIKVMNQYEKAYQNFKFIGPSPIDFDKKLGFNQCVWNELCNLSISQLKNMGKTIIGIIFNLDPHYKGGSHWVSMYIDINTKELYYFDSVGTIIPKRIERLKKSIISQCNYLDIPLKFDQLYPKIEHQKENTECGMYCLYFIIKMLKKEKKWNDFLTTRVPDEEMIKFRNIFFNKKL